MADVTTDINQSRAMRIARRRVEGFAEQFGEAHRNLARHAAFPLVLTPDLLYQIWANFVPEAPWVAVAHVLLSRLCRQVGYEMYEIDIADRNLLLWELKEEFGQERFDELGEFLLDYVAQRLTDDDADTQDLREAQEWTALAYTKPDEAARELAQKLSERVQQEDMGEMLRLASLVETLAEPLVEAGFEPLLVYSRGISNFVRGKSDNSKTESGELFSVRGKIVDYLKGYVTTLSNLWKKTSQTTPSKIRLGIWGTSGAGKTTYMVQLYRVLQQSCDWVVQPTDEKSEVFVLENLKQIEHGFFPLATSLSETEKLEIYSYTLTNSGRDFGSKIVLDFLDVPGAFYENILHTKRLKFVEEESLSSDIVDYLLSCDGIIFLLDPERDGKVYSTLLWDLFYELQSRSRSITSDDRLQQYMAFCVTKVDRNELYNKAERTPPRELVKEVMGERIFQRLFSSFLLEGNFEFFYISSVGVSVDTDGNLLEAVIYQNENISESLNTQQFDIDTQNNFDTDKAESTHTFANDFASDNNNKINQEVTLRKHLTIRQDVKLQPINVIEPIKWLINAIKTHPPYRSK